MDAAKVQAALKELDQPGSVRGLPGYRIRAVLARETHSVGEDAP